MLVPSTACLCWAGTDIYFASSAHKKRAEFMARQDTCLAVDAKHECNAH